MSNHITLDDVKPRRSQPAAPPAPARRAALAPAPANVDAETPEFSESSDPRVAAEMHRAFERNFVAAATASLQGAAQSIASLMIAADRGEQAMKDAGEKVRAAIMIGFLFATEFAKMHAHGITIVRPELKPDGSMNWEAVADHDPVHNRDQPIPAVKARLEEGTIKPSRMPLMTLEDYEVLYGIADSDAPAA